MRENTTTALSTCKESAKREPVSFANPVVPEFENETAMLTMGEEGCGGPVVESFIHPTIIHPMIHIERTIPTASTVEENLLRFMENTPNVELKLS